MAATPSDEDSAIADIDAAVGAVLSKKDIQIVVETALDRTVNNDYRQISNIERNILFFLLSKKFDLDVTYSWNLSGPKIEFRPNQTDSTYTKSVSVSAPTQQSNDVVRRKWTGLGSNAQVDDNRVQQFIDYLASETLFNDYSLREVWFMQRHKFLHDFCDEFAPETYREAYFASIEIRRRLANLEEVTNRQEQVVPLSEFGANEQPFLTSSEEEAFRHTVSELHLALARGEALASTTEAVTAGTDLIERTLDRLTRVEPSTENQWELIKELVEFFFYTVWRLPALVISIQTAQGPNAEELQARQAQRLNRLFETAQYRRDEFQRRLADADLLPTIEEERHSDSNIEYGISLSDE
jgi:hypothetical protein